MEKNKGFWWVIWFVHWVLINGTELHRQQDMLNNYSLKKVKTKQAVLKIWSTIGKFSPGLVLNKCTHIFAEVITISV